MEEVTLDSITMRREEVQRYQENIEMYQIILTSLPTHWPERLAKFKGTLNEHKAVAEIEDMEDVVLISKLFYAESCKAAIRAETLEMTKALSILSALEAQRG